MGKMMKDEESEEVSEVILKRQQWEFRNLKISKIRNSIYRFATALVTAGSKQI